MKKIFVLLLATLLILPGILNAKDNPKLENINKADIISTSISTKSPVRSSNQVLERINALILELQKNSENIRNNNRKIEALLFKNWILAADFEKDMTTLMPIFRESVDSYGNLSNIIKDLKSEVFDESQFCFAQLEASLEKSGTAFNEAYAGMREGKTKLGIARTKYTESRSEYENTSKYIQTLVDQFRQFVHPQPAPQVHPAPQPHQPLKIKVFVHRQRINPGKYTIINEYTPIGIRVMKEAKKQMKNMDTLERIQFKFAITGTNGFSYAIVKINKHRYDLYWWHMLDTIADIIQVITEN